MAIETRRFHQPLATTLTPEEVKARAEESATLDGEIEKAKTELKAITHDRKAEISDRESRRKQLQKEVREKTTIRSVECEERKDFGTGYLSVHRLDTGEEVQGSRRELSGEERQRGLGLDDPPRSLAAEKALDEEGAKIEEAEGAAAAADEMRALRGRRTKRGKSA